jgi:hypothetical protein
MLIQKMFSRNWIRSRSHNSDLRLRGAEAERNIYGSATLKKRHYRTILNTTVDRRKPRDVGSISL